MLSETTYPDLFSPSLSKHTPSAALSTSEILAIITASAPAFPQTASRLTTLKDQSIPPTSASTALIALQPRLLHLEREQAGLKREIAELRSRSARIVERWYELGVLGDGECWGEWESRASGCERMVRRLEREKQEEANENDAYET